MTLSPKTELWLPFLSSWFQGSVAEDLIWYRDYSSESAANNTLSLNWKLRLSRFTSDLGAARIATSARPGFEIDARVHHIQTDYTGAASIWFLPTTALDITIKRSELNFDEQSPVGLQLKQQLNGSTVSYSVGVSRKLTRVTSISVAFTERQDRFTYNELRNANAMDVSGSVRFEPGGYFKGGVSAGFTGFSPKSNSLPNYTGATFSADVSFDPTEVTRLTLRAERAIRYSYDEQQPYYVQTGMTAEITQQIYGPLDVVGRGGAARPAYRTRDDVVVPFADRADRVTTYGAGVGYHLGQNVRVSVNADQNHRASPVVSRRYDRLTYGASLTYDF